MDINTIMNGVQTVSILLGIIVAATTLRGRDNQKAADLAVMQRDIEYIKDKVGELPGFRERITAVEESAKQAHKRIDRIERQE